MALEGSCSSDLLYVLRKRLDNCVAAVKQQKVGAPNLCEASARFGAHLIIARGLEVSLPRTTHQPTDPPAPNSVSIN